MAPEPEAVFVYGTLRRGFQNAGRDVLTAHGDLRGEATVPGALYDLGSFPALVEPDEEGDRVRGEVYELAREPERALERLDRYEGARGPNPLPYERRALPARLAGGSTLEVWTYVWTGEVGDSPRVEGGDYVAHVRGD